MPKKFQLATTVASVFNLFEVEKAPNVSAKHWRMFIETCGTTFIQITELEFRTAKGVVDNESVVATASSTNSTNTAANCRDKNLSTFWQSVTGANEWIAFEYPTARKVVDVVYAGISATNRTPYIFRIEYSDDGINWKPWARHITTGLPTVGKLYSVSDSTLILMDTPVLPAGNRYHGFTISKNSRWLAGQITSTTAGTAYTLFLCKRKGRNWPISDSKDYTHASVTPSDAVFSTRVKMNDDATRFAWINSGTLYTCTREGNLLTDPVAITGVTGGVQSLAISPDGNTIAYQGTGNLLKVIQLIGGVWTDITSGSTEYSGHGIEFSPNGRWLVSHVANTRTITVYEIKNGSIAFIANHVHANAATTGTVNWASNNKAIITPRSTNATLVPVEVVEINPATAVSTLTLDTTVSRPYGSLSALSPDGLEMYVLSIAASSSVIDVSGNVPETQAPFTLPATFSGTTGVDKYITSSDFYYEGLTELYDIGINALINRNMPINNMKIMLLNGNASFVASAASIAAVTNSGANVISVPSVPTDGKSLTNVRFDNNTSFTSFSADDIDIINDSVTDMEVYGAVIYDATTGYPLLFINMESMAVTVGETLTITMTDGIIQFRK